MKLNGFFTFLRLFLLLCSIRGERKVKSCDVKGKMTWIEDEKDKKFAREFFRIVLRGGGDVMKEVGRTLDN